MTQLVTPIEYQGRLFESHGAAIDRIERRLEAIESRDARLESQFRETQEMIQTLIDMVQSLASDRRAHSRSSIHASRPTESPIGGRTASAMALRKAPIRPRTRSRAGPELMTRMISTKNIQDAAPPPTTTALGALGPAVRRIARAASTTALRVPDSIVPRLRRRSSTHSPEHLGRHSTWWSHKSSVHPTPEGEKSPRTKTADALPTSHPWTIAHDSSSRAAWDVLVLLLVLIDVVVTPLAMSFGYASQFLSDLDVVETVVFSLDVVVHALSSFTTKRGVVVAGPAHTIPHYALSIWALADVLACLPFGSFLSNGQFFEIAKVIRLVKISQLMRRFQSSKKAGMVRLLRLISIVLLVSHWLTCYWNWVAKVWRLHEDRYVEKPLLEQCVHSWSIVIGSLNASPPTMFTPLEEFSVAIFMLIGNVLQASVFGSVAVLIQSFNEDEVADNKKLISTYERCKLLDIPEPLADRITSYYEHLYRETRSVDPDADAFINELSPALICEVKFQLYRDMIKQIPFFSSAHINPVLIETLVLRLRTVMYMQDDMLIRKGEFGDWMGFIGSKSSVGVLDPNTEAFKIVRILRKGEYFGEMGLLHRTNRMTTAVALSWVQIHVLTRGDLDEVKEQYAEDAESLDHEIRTYIRSAVSARKLVPP